MLCAVITGPSYEQAKKQLTQVQKICSLVELRLDFFEKIHLDQLHQLKIEFHLPMIFTLRPISQGGKFDCPEKERLSIIKDLASLNPEYIDLEFSIPSSFIDTLKQQNNKTQIIISFHDFHKMPDLDRIFENLKRQSAELYKIAVMVKSTLDALSLLEFMKIHQGKVTGIGMGICGEITRILSPIYGGKIVYASVTDNSSTAPGQLTVNQLFNHYHLMNINPSTSIFGSIDLSTTTHHLSRIYNTFFHMSNLSAVFVDFYLTLHELRLFLIQCKKLGVKGLNVSQPFKKAIIPYLDLVDPIALEIGEVDTVMLDKNIVKGFNLKEKKEAIGNEDFGVILNQLNLWFCH